MRIRTLLCIAVGVSLASLSGARAQDQTPAAVPSIEADRYAEYALSQYQTRVMNEATKLSYACRKFRYLFDRWPADIDELRQKVSGIDFTVFRGKATVTPKGGDAAEISVFDGVNTRSVLATPIDFDLPASAKEAAKNPGSVISVGEIKLRNN